ncbi:MAG: hypothetical protein IIW23_03020 [Clostridia bacterium]|nr:hypothetical protein [Clostridia bacterium]
MKKAASVIIVILLFITVVGNLLFFAKDAFIHDMENLPEGKLLFSTMSTDPYQSYTVQIYQLKDEDGPGDAVRAVCINNADGSKRNIYWKTNETNALVTWESDYVVVINNTAIDVRTQSYNWRYPKVVEK